MVLPDRFIYLPEVFSPEEAAEHLRALIEQTPWETHTFQICGRTIEVPRRTAMYGPHGYAYSGISHPPRPLTPRLDAIRRVVEAATGRSFNSVLLNLYRDGRDSVSWHRDNDYPHGGQPDIASVSFGAIRRFDARDRRGRRRFAIDLEPGSVLIMTGEALSAWWHRVPKTTRPVGPRINLTFRHMTGPSEAGGGPR